MVSFKNVIYIKIYILVAVEKVEKFVRLSI